MEQSFSPRHDAGGVVFTGSDRGQHFRQNGPRHVCGTQGRGKNNSLQTIPGRKYNQHTKHRGNRCVHREIYSRSRNTEVDY